ncbi:MAG: prepilin peptidase, partial [Nanoarchaeota archaeon]
MQEYYFLFAVGLAFTLFAVFQDIKKREIANWLNFSLLAFALGYRVFYSLLKNNYQFLLVGLLSLAIFFCISNLLYYTRAFAGGDAKLLIAYSLIIPFQNYQDLIPISLIFTLTLFLGGTIYTLVYSIFIAKKNKEKFKKDFKSRVTKQNYLSLICLALSIT